MDTKISQLGWLNRRAYRKLVTWHLVAIIDTYLHPALFYNHYYLYSVILLIIIMVNKPPAFIIKLRKPGRTSPPVTRPLWSAGFEKVFWAEDSGRKIISTANSKGHWCPLETAADDTLSYQKPESRQCDPWRGSQADGGVRGPGGDQGLAQGCRMKQVLPEALLSLLFPYTLSPLLCPNHVPSWGGCGVCGGGPQKLFQAETSSSLCVPFPGKCVPSN